MSQDEDEILLIGLLLWQYDGFTCAQPYRQICDSMPFPTQCLDKIDLQENCPKKA